METYHALRAEGLPFSEQYQIGRPPVLDVGEGGLLDRPSSNASAGGCAFGRAGIATPAATQPSSLPRSSAGGVERGGGEAASDLRELSGGEIVLMCAKKNGRRG